MVNGKVKTMPSRGELLYIIGNIDTNNTVRDRALVALEYLSGARISEILQVKRKQIERITKIDMEFIQINNVITLKRRKSIYRNIIIPILREKDYLKLVVKHIEHIPPDMPLFGITRQRAWQIINEHTGFYNHYFRHMRATHLTTDYGFTAQELKKFFGWASSKMADNYSHLNMDDIARKMIVNSVTK